MSKHITIRMPDLYINIINQYMIDTGLTRSAAVKELLLHGVNYYYNILQEEEDGEEDR